MEELVEPFDFVRACNCEHRRAQTKLREPRGSVGNSTAGFASARAGEAFFAQAGQRRKACHDQVDKEIAYDDGIPLFVCSHAGRNGHSRFWRAHKRYAATPTMR